MCPEEKKFIVKDNIRDGIFSNIFKIYRKADEVILDFGREAPEREDVEVKVRVVMTVEGARSLMELIRDFVEIEAPKKFKVSYVA